MKKIREVKIEGEINGYIDRYKDSVIIKQQNSIEEITQNLELNTLVTGNIFTAKVLDDELLYQLDNGYNIRIYGKTIELNDGHSYGLISAFKFDTHIYIYSDSDNEYEYCLLDKNLNICGRIKALCNFSYKKWLLRAGLNNVICYNMNDKLWHYKHSESSKVQILSGYKDKIIIYSDKGDLFALNLEDGLLDWEFSEKCFKPKSSYGDHIYVFNTAYLIEVSAQSGEKERAIEIKHIEEKENFSINRIKAYEDYLFCMDTFGVIAIIDRETLMVKDILRFEKHLINSQDSLQWVNNRLYVQDVEKTIHIFE